MNELELEELNSAIARYLPDRQLITFSSAMMIAPKEGNAEGGFKDIREISYFFHEWLHYLHNISTVHGVSAFVALTETWSAFRSTTNSFGISSGEINHTSPELFQVKALMELYSASRKSKSIRLPKDIAPGDVAVTSFVEQAWQGDVGAAYLDITVLYANKYGNQTEATIVLGALEILESVAFLLEKRFLERLSEQQVEQAVVVPYHVLTIFARHIAPSLSEEDVLMCGLASLQSTVPANDLVLMLKQCESVDSDASIRRQYLTNQVIEQMKLGEPKYLAWLDRIDAMFSHPKSIGLAMKETIDYMRRNLELRKTRPFFEVDFIEEIRSAGAINFPVIMERLLATHGTCKLRQEHLGSDDEIGRDLLFEFKVAGQDDELNAARRIMQASFDYVFRHFSTEGGFLATTRAKQRPCPFYTSCALPLRNDRPADCKNTPWNSVHLYQQSLCWYGEGVLNLKSGAPQKELKE